MIYPRIRFFKREERTTIFYGNKTLEIMAADLIGKMRNNAGVEVFIDKK